MPTRLNAAASPAVQSASSTLGRSFASPRARASATSFLAAVPTELARLERKALQGHVVITPLVKIHALHSWMHGWLSRFYKEEHSAGEEDQAERLVEDLLEAWTRKVEVSPRPRPLPMIPLRSAFALQG